MKKYVSFNPKVGLFFGLCLLQMGQAGAMFITVKKILCAPVAGVVGTYNFVTSIPEKVTTGVSNYFDPVNPETKLATPSYKRHVAFGAVAGAGVNGGLIYLLGGNTEETARAAFVGGGVGMPLGGVVCFFRKGYSGLEARLDRVEATQGKHTETLENIKETQGKHTGQLDGLTTNVAALNTTVNDTVVPGLREVKEIALENGKHIASVFDKLKTLNEETQKGFSELSFVLKEEKEKTAGIILRLDAFEQRVGEGFAQAETASQTRHRELLAAIEMNEVN